MCLYTNQMKPQIAKKDIKVYKCIRVSMFSPIQKFHYNLGETYETTFTKSFRTEDIYFNTLMFRTDMERVAKKSKRWKAIYSRNVNFIEISRGLHACLFKDNKLVDFDKREDVWYNAIIPKGSEFYVSPLGDIVSNKLVVISKCD